MKVIRPSPLGHETPGTLLEDGNGVEASTPGKATITVTRRSTKDVRVRQIYISVDGRNIAELLFGDSVTTEVDAGTHRLRANNTLVWKTVPCHLRPGEHARFSVVNRPGFGSYAMLSLLGSGPIYLSFNREPDVTESASSTSRG